MIYTTHPDLPFHPLTYLDTPRLTGGKRRDSWVGYTVDADLISASLDKHHVAGRLVYLDLEKQPGWTWTTAEREAYAAALLASILAVREHLPGARIALYGVPKLDINGLHEWAKPTNTADRKTRYAKRLREASKINADYGRTRDPRGRYTGSGVMDAADLLCPNLYHFGDASDIAEQVADDLAELNRPVAPTLWPSQHASAAALASLVEPQRGRIRDCVIFERHDFTPPAGYGERLDVMREVFDGVH